MAEPRDFPLSDILTVTTGRLLSRDGIEGVYRILRYLTGDQIMTHQIPDVIDACHLPVLAQHPQLLDVVPVANADLDRIDAWLTVQESRFGSTLPLLPVEGWERRDPVGELVDKVGPVRSSAMAMPVNASGALSSRSRASSSKSVNFLSVSVICASASLLMIRTISAGRDRQYGA